MKWDKLRAILATVSGNVSIYDEQGTRVASINTHAMNAERRLELGRMMAASPRMRDALQQIEIAARETDKNPGYLAKMLGDIAREVLK